MGFLLLALFSIGLIENPSTALHSFTVGAMGGMILAMISRITLGHTGRPLKPPRIITLAYISILLSAAVRVLLPAVAPSYSNWSITLAGGLWVLAYAIYLTTYAHMLITPDIEDTPE
ncbi:NnrS family protein [Candidatus Reidiella endopervernicosa]|uniref:NnrS family protein n=1 Tax=Candidatus Reidiella endopervernicosa TaxID=2738883 RepID=UPI002351993E|nr:NnrS family protein [Candidatus Reidiella endopervernicosa]